MSLHRPPARRRGPALVALLALLAGLAACGSSPAGEGVVSLADPSASPDASAAPSASLDPEDAIIAFERCMKEHGVDVQIAITGGPGGGAVGGTESGSSLHVGGEAPAPGENQPAAGAPDLEKAKAADAACRHLLPAGGMGDPNATMDPALADQMLAFAKCMRDHGIDFPDPQFEGGGVSIQIGGPDGSGGVDPMSEAFQAAQTACAKDMPGGGPFVVGAGPGGPGGPSGPNSVPAPSVQP
jgi:hypothetical protein